jgi:hypothetical protein
LAHIETFFADYANSACDGDAALDGDALLELFQGVLTGHAVELIQMNDGEYFVLGIYSHDVHAWNCSEEGNFHVIVANAPKEGREYYRFPSLGAAIEALQIFTEASLRDQN